MLNPGDDKELFVPGFTKIYALDRAGIDNRRVQTLVQVLRLVNVAQGYIIQTVIFDQGARQHQIAAQHNGTFAAVRCALH